MRKTLFSVIVITVFLLSGCASHYSQYRKVDGPLVTYTHETFIDEDTRETGLFIDGEDWYGLIDLSGFEDLNKTFVGPTQFLYQENEEGILVSAFAEKIDGVTDSESCMHCFNKSYFRNMQKIGGKTVTYHEDKKEIGDKIIVIRNVAVEDLLRRNVHINYYPYYNGYCFDFHFSFILSSEEQKSIDKVIEIIDSIRFIDGKFSNVLIKKLFYIGHKRLQLLVPDTWQFSHEKEMQNLPPTIKFVPVKGNSFAMCVTLFIPSGKSPIPVEKVKKAAEGKMSEAAIRAVEEPVLKERGKNNSTVYYFEFTDKDHKPEDPDDYPFICQGYGAVNGSVLYFTIFYRENGKVAAQKGLDAITNAKLIKLN